MENAPVITIDGPSGAGKGTVAQKLAAELDYHLLDSGAVYRAAALHALNLGADVDSSSNVMSALSSLNAHFSPHPDGVKVTLDDQDVTRQLRSEKTAAAASKVASMQVVRSFLLDHQRSFRKPPGLIADGRDMGTVVFPDATLKVFLSASIEVRANRRAKQLKGKGISTTMAGLLQEIVERDHRDCSREHSPLVAAQDAIVIDSSNLAIDDVVSRIMRALPQLTAT